jgi:hypothetical protein
MIEVNIRPSERKGFAASEAGGAQQYPQAVQWIIVSHIEQVMSLINRKCVWFAAFDSRRFRRINRVAAQKLEIDGLSQG